VRQPVSSVCALILSFALGVATTLQVKTLRDRSSADDAQLPSPSSLVGADSAQCISPLNCSGLVVAVNGGGLISINHERLGTLDDTAPLVSRLKAILRERETSGVEQQGIELCRDFTSGDVMGGVVYVRAPRSLPYGDLAILLDAVEGSGAKSIKLALEDEAQDF
jgi:biopolymer transport protein ExbD